MEFVEALQEVLDAASQPKQYPPGVTPVTLPSVPSTRKISRLGLGTSR